MRRWVWCTSKYSIEFLSITKNYNLNRGRKKQSGFSLKNKTLDFPNSWLKGIFPCICSFNFYHWCFSFQCTDLSTPCFNYSWVLSGSYYKLRLFPCVFRQSPCYTSELHYICLLVSTVSSWSLSCFLWKTYQQHSDFAFSAPLWVSFLKPHCSGKDIPHYGKHSRSLCSLLQLRGQVFSISLLRIHGLLVYGLCCSEVSSFYKNLGESF